MRARPWPAWRTDPACSASRPCSATPGSIEITVADTGAGVAEPELERIFEPFVSSKAEGLGMGLSINRSIVEAHGGQIVATRNPDRGLTLRVTLPTASGHADEHDSPRLAGPEEPPQRVEQHPGG